MVRKAKPKTPEVYVPPEFVLQVNSLINIDFEINELFNSILIDYCRRFKTVVKPEKVDTRIMVSLVQGGSSSNDMDGLCVFDSRDKLTTLQIQIRCIVIENMEPNPFAVQHWMEILCHEMVHACQYLTGRVMPKPEMVPSELQSEDYYFDPDEMEARLLQAPYANAINREATMEISNKIVECFADDEDESEETILLKLLYEEADIRY